ncbi:hypothetical protein, partial [Anaerolinea sp.]|uniref:hypothetical protein n=1 Tax=Anaerolinea sp. TaxID=1872519 RepID=UPI002ACE0EC5
MTEAEKARIRAEAKTKGLAAGFTLAHTAAAEAAAKTESLRRKKEQEREQEKVQNYLQSKAAFEAVLRNPALSAAEKARIREEAKTKGLAAGFTAAQSAVAQTASHRGADEKIERMESRITQLEKNLKSHFRRPADDQPPSKAVIIPPLTNEQYAAVKDWNTAAQVVTYGITAMIGGLIGLVVGKHPLLGLAGAVAGVMWGAYEALCIASVQDEFDAAHQQGNGVTVWRDGWKFNV